MPRMEGGAIVAEVVILPEMLAAGIEALQESVGLSEEDKCVAVFLAMRAVEEIAVMRDQHYGKPH